MSLSRENMMQVMSYVDGELSGEALDKVEALLASDDEASQLAIELRTLGECVRVVHTDRKLEKNPDEIADDVMRELEKRLAPIGSLAERRRNAAITAAISCAIAVAAGWFLFVKAGADGYDTSAQSNPPPAVTQPSPSAQTSVTPTPAELAAQIPAAGGVDVESVESPSHEVSVFYVPAMASASSNASSVVVWIQEGEAKK
ncbi:MAG: anti-sigma factor family protein [Polyangiaceae bacterium]